VNFRRRSNFRHPSLGEDDITGPCEYRRNSPLITPFLRAVVNPAPVSCIGHKNAGWQWSEKNGPVETQGDSRSFSVASFQLCNHWYDDSRGESSTTAAAGIWYDDSYRESSTTAATGLWCDDNRGGSGSGKSLRVWLAPPRRLTARLEYITCTDGKRYYTARLTISKDSIYIGSRWTGQGGYR
jgi:hypothetical protein